MIIGVYEIGVFEKIYDLHIRVKNTLPRVKVIH
jgi:hypothetical protein